MLTYFRDRTDDQLVRVRAEHLRIEALGPDGRWRAYQFNWSAAPLSPITEAEARATAGAGVDLHAESAPPASFPRRDGK